MKARKHETTIQTMTVYKWKDKCRWLSAMPCETEK